MTGFLVTGAGTLAALGESFYDFRGTPVEWVLYSVALAVGYGLVGCAWFVLSGPGGVAPAHRGRLRLSLLLFVAASAVLAAGWLGQVDAFETIRLHWRLLSVEPRLITFGWLVTAIGLGITACGFWGLRAADVVEEGSFVGLDPAFGPMDAGPGPTPSAAGIVLGGFGLLALGTGLLEWFTGAESIVPHGLLVSDVATVLGYGLLGVAWFLFLSESSVTGRAGARAYRLLALASLIVAVGSALRFWPYLFSSPHHYRILASGIIGSAGLVVVALGFRAVSAPVAEPAPPPPPADLVGVA